MVARIFAPHPQAAQDPDVATHHEQRRRKHQLAELATHMVHTISALVVMAIVAYFIYEYGKGVTGSPFWTALAIMSILVSLFALSRTLFMHRAGDAALAMFTLAGLWLAAVVLALTEYLDSSCPGSNPSLFDQCDLRKLHIAFSLVAFLTSLIAMVLEIQRWRHNQLPVLVDDKASQTSGSVTGMTTMGAAQNTSYPPAQTTSLPPQNMPYPGHSYSLPPQNTPFPAT